MGEVAGSSPWLVVGLGNPGPEYEATRHNIGHMVAQELVSRVGGRFARHKAQAMVATGMLGTPGAGGHKVYIAKPLTYMNLSGGPVAGLARYAKIPAERIVVVHDELDIDFGAVKCKSGGGEGGHNGLRSISSSLGTKEYVRVRVGIGRPPGQMAASDYVLGRFGKQERQELPFVWDKAADAVEVVLSQGLLAAQQRFHSR